MSVYLLEVTDALGAARHLLLRLCVRQPQVWKQIVWQALQ